MIYKFNDLEQGTILEIELFNEESQTDGPDDVVTFSMCLDIDRENFISFDFNKKELFKLIGALHCLQKEMK